VNTANVAVLHSLGDNMSESEVDSLLDERADDGFESIQNIVDKIDPDLAPAVTLSSDYFRVTSDISIGTYRLTMYSLLERGENGIVRPVNRQNGIE
jgi:general secretion pathway protein K